MNVEKTEVMISSESQKASTYIGISMSRCL